MIRIKIYDDISLIIRNKAKSIWYIIELLAKKIYNSKIYPSLEWERNLKESWNKEIIYFFCLLFINILG